MMHLSIHLEYQLCIDIQIYSNHRNEAPRSCNPVKDPEAEPEHVDCFAE